MRGNNICGNVWCEPLAINVTYIVAAGNEILTLAAPDHEVAAATTVCLNTDPMEHSP
jgi:hypothetical protein